MESDKNRKKRCSGWKERRNRPKIGRRNENETWMEHTDKAGSYKYRKQDRDKEWRSNRNKDDNINTGNKKTGNKEDIQKNGHAGKNWKTKADKS